LAWIPAGIGGGDWKVLYIWGVSKQGKGIACV
jgi:hypothetical protein